MVATAGNSEGHGHGYGVEADCICGRNFSKVRGLREHLTKARLAEAREILTAANDDTKES